MGCFIIFSFSWEDGKFCSSRKEEQPSDYNIDIKGLKSNQSYRVQKESINEESGMN